MVKQPEKEHEIERADLLGREMVDVRLPEDDARAEQLRGDRESRPLGGHVVDGEHVGAAAFQLEREEAVARADVQHAHAGAVGRQLEHLQLQRRVVDAGRDDAGTHFDPVVPARVGRDHRASVRVGHQSSHRSTHYNASGPVASIQLTSIEYLPAAAEWLSGCVIDLPRVGDPADGHVLEVAGWVVGRHTPVATIEILHDTHWLTGTPVLLVRPDVTRYIWSSPTRRCARAFRWR